jgi:hypothetical protein
MPPEFTMRFAPRQRAGAFPLPPAVVTIVLFLFVAHPARTQTSALQEVTAAGVAQGSSNAQQSSAPTLSDEEIERFLRESKVVRTRGTSKGVTGSIRATLTDGTMTHDAHIQTVDERKASIQLRGSVEFDFRDSYAFNIAAYRIDRMVGLNLVPVSIERRWQTKPAAFTWWVDDVMLDEGERMKKKVEPPQPAVWNESMQLMRIFDQLIYNTDRNLGNVLITKDWRVWAIDHTRAFRRHKTLKTPENVTRCDRQMVERMKQLDLPSLKRDVGNYLTDWELEALLARRDAIVALLEKRGPSALFDRQQK